jgi:hypothetical protein
LDPTFFPTSGRRRKEEESDTVAKKSNKTFMMPMRRPLGYVDSETENQFGMKENRLL